MKKRFLPLVLVLALCVSMITPAFAAATLTVAMTPDEVQRYVNDETLYLDKSFHEGVAWAGNFHNDYGLIDNTGKELVAPHSYETVQAFSEGIAWAAKGNRWDAVDTKGNVLFSLNTTSYFGVRALQPSPFSDGLARVRNTDTEKYGYIDRTGKFVLPFEYDEKTGDFNDGLARVYDAAEAYYGYMDKTGKVVIPCRFTEAKDFVHGVAAVKLGKRWTVIDTAGNELLPAEYSYREDYNRWPDNITAQAVEVMDQSGKVAWLNRAGEVISEGFAKTDTRFSDGMMRVYTYRSGNKSVGYLNESGRLAIPVVEGTAMYDFMDGYALIQKKGSKEYTVIDKAGREVGSFPTDGKFVNTYMEGNDVTPSFDEIHYAGAGCFSVSSDETGRTRYGFVDCTGRQIVPCNYAALMAFSGGVAAVKNFDNKWGLVNTDGTLLVPCTLSRVDYANEPGVFLVRGYQGDERQCMLKATGWKAPDVPVDPTPVEPAPEQTIEARWDNARGHRYAYDTNGKQILGVSGESVTVSPEGDLRANGNIYYMNPERDPANPDSCYLMTNYVRVRPDDGGRTFYDADGISFHGWMHAEGGGMRFQTRLENVPGKDPYCIYVWHAQYLDECQHPDHPGDPAYNIPAGWYLFGDDGVRIEGSGEYDFKYDVDHQMHHYTLTDGRITAIDGVPV